jgi:hypothetical protein
LFYSRHSPATFNKSLPAWVLHHLVTLRCPFHHEQGALNIACNLLRPLLLLLFVFGIPRTGAFLCAQTGPNPNLIDDSSSGEPPPALNAPERKLKAAAELHVEEQQRILGIMPNFNTSNVKDAEPLSPGQKFDLAAKGAFDPFTFVVAGLDAGLSQGENDFPEYRQGALGYAKRFGASYADSFSSTMLGSALFPILLKQDPRYFRKGTGSFTSRFWFAVMSELKCKNDHGNWTLNYSNLLGNIAAGGISNFYYPASDRGVGLTFERAATVTAEGAVGAVFVEFWPDMSRKLFPKHRDANSP